MAVVGVLGRLCMYHGRVTWTYGHYTPSNYRNVRLPARLIWRLIPRCQRNSPIWPVGVLVLVLHPAYCWGLGVRGACLYVFHNARLEPEVGYSLLYATMEENYARGKWHLTSNIEHRTRPTPNTPPTSNTTPHTHTAMSMSMRITAFC